jgi:hypothetical protein
MSISTNITTASAPARVSREAWIGVGATVLAIVAMAVDHMFDEDGGFAADPSGFAIACALSIALAVYLFGRVVPRALAHPERGERAARDALRLAGITLVSMPTAWLGLPFVLAGATLALGLVGRHSMGRRRATVAAGFAVLVLLAGAADYVEQTIDKLG